MTNGDKCRTDTVSSPQYGIIPTPAPKTLVEVCYD